MTKRKTPFAAAAKHLLDAERVIKGWSADMTMKQLDGLAALAARVAHKAHSHAVLKAADD